MHCTWLVYKPRIDPASSEYIADGNKENQHKISIHWLHVYR